MKQEDIKIRKYFEISLFTSLIVSVLMGSIFGFLSAGLSEKNIKEYFDQKNNQKTENLEAVASIEIKEEDDLVVRTVENVSPAVVSVIVTKDVPKLDSYFFNPFLSDPFFNPFGYEDYRQENSETEKREIGGGTGFIVSPDGYILTNRHVVNDEEAEYTVMMNDGTKEEAEVLAVDSFLDIAVIKIKKEGLPFVSFGNSDELKIGQTVIAIGNSLGEFRNTVSKGIISGLKRDVSAGDGMGKTELLEEVIQTDAAINPGNSGGPLLDLSGKVIGINVAMAQGAENIGFSIPINQVKNVFESVKKTGKISRPYLGVRYIIINEQIKEDNNLDFDYGALILRGESRTELAVIPNSPADKAGILENDIILEIDGQKINQENDLAKIIRKKEVGEEISLKVWSKGQEKNLKIKLGESS